MHVKVTALMLAITLVSGCKEEVVGCAVGAVGGVITSALTGVDPVTTITVGCAVMVGERAAANILGY